MKELRLKAVKDFCRFIDNFDGELVIIGKNAYHKVVIVKTYELWV